MESGSGTDTAQAAYNALVRNHLSPSFRALGFKGSSGNYQLVIAEDGWATLGLQKWRYSNRAEVRFTVNLQAVSRAAWAVGRLEAPEWPARPSPNLDYGVGDNTRLGHLMNRHERIIEDVWWHVGAEQELEPVASAVVDAVQALGVPWLRERAARF